MICGIVAEYNPFHNGHSYQLEATKRLGADGIVCVMSGSFVQRGGAAIFDKWTRASAALKCGADLVVELPVNFVLSSAKRFAFGAVYTLNQLGVDSICFGSESGDISALTKAAQAVKALESSDEFKRIHQMGLSYPKSLFEAAASQYGDEIASIVASPNNLLGIEYINAISEINPKIRPITLPRIGVDHNSTLPQGNFASASMLRERIESGGLASISQYIPIEASKLYNAAFESGYAPILTSRLNMPFLFLLRQMSAEDFAKLDEVAEGLENRLYTAAKEAQSVDDFLTKVKTKRYTMARLRRILCRAAIGLDKSPDTPEYIRILASNEQGFKIIASSDTLLPHSPKFADLAKAAPSSVLDSKATDLAFLAAPAPLKCGIDYEKSVVIEKQ